MASTDQSKPNMSSSPPPPIDLKHMTSATALVSPTRDHRASHRASQHFLGSRSPNSIPSSPTSIHSSSSAIFERDIEPILPPSPPHSLHHPPNPHRIPRSKGTEQLEQSVPSVLDSAAAVLGSMDEGEFTDQVAVVAPAQSTAFNDMGRSSGFASPIGSFRSRSPSPLGSRVGAGQARAELLLSIPHPHSHQPASSVIASPQSVLGTQNIVSPSISIVGATSSSTTVSPSALASASPSRPQNKPTDTSATITQVSSSNTSITGANSPRLPSISAPADYSSPIDPYSDDPSPITTTQERPPANNIHGSPALSPVYPLTSTQPQPQSLMSSPIASPSSTTHTALSQISHPPSPVHVAKKRLSFMSYSDLLSSTPASMQTLSSLTTYASASEPPPHIPSVSGLNIASAIHAQAQSASTSAAPSLRNFSMVPTGGLTHAGKRDSIAMLDNLGGEWERQGLGRGLEERLEALVLPPAASASSVTALGPTVGVPMPFSQTVDGGKA